MGPDRIKFNNLYEGEPLNEIAKKVNIFLDPILEENFDIKSRKEYINNKNSDLNQKILKTLGRAENLGLIESDGLDEQATNELHDALSEDRETTDLINETKPENRIPIDCINKIKEIDKDGRLEKEISKIYQMPGVSRWGVFFGILNATLPDDPFLWDKIKKESELAK